MDALNKIKDWAAGLAHAGVSLIGLGIVLEILFSGMNVPFWPDVHVIDNILGLVSTFSDQGLVGLVAIAVLWHIWKKKYTSGGDFISPLF